MFKKNLSFYIKIITIVFVSISIFSCRKYQDDPQLISLRTPEKRLEGKWDLSFVEENNTDVTKKYQTYNLIFDKNNQLTRSRIDTINGWPNLVSEIGNWRLTHNNQRLEFNFDSITEDYSINSLTTRQLSLRSVNLTQNRLLLLTNTK